MGLYSMNPRIPHGELFAMVFRDSLSSELEQDSVGISDARRRNKQKVILYHLASVSSRGKRMKYNKLRRLLISYGNNRIGNTYLRMQRVRAMKDVPKTGMVRIVHRTCLHLL